jgi:hypothetical protein
LGRHQIRDVVVNRSADKQNVVFQQPRIDMYARSPRVVSSMTMGMSIEFGSLAPSADL